MRTAFACAFVAFLCSSCGGSSNPESGPEGLSPLLVRVHDGDVHVPPLVILEVVLPDGVSPASVAPAGVSLTGDVATGDAPTPVGVAVDASARVVRVQSQDFWLYPGRRYLLMLDGLTDSGGTPVAPVLVTFTVLRNPVVRESRIDSYMPPPGLAYAPDWLAESEFDADGFPTAKTYYAPGTDGILGTADDPVLVWQSMDGTPTLGHVTTTLYTDPGTDGIWSTDDDVVGGRTETSYDAHGQELLRVDRLAGADRLIDTGDDVVTCHAYVVEVDGSLTSGACDAGGDGQYGTADDGFAAMARWHYGADGRLAWMETWSSGPDATWGTADDALVQVTVHEASGGTEIYTDWDVGPDGLWDTADDQELRYRLDQTTSPGNVTSAYYGYPGNDSTWGTADDIIDTLVVGTTSGLTTTSLEFISPGNDGRWGTGDDVADLRSWVTRVEGGAVTALEWWTAGTDGILDTPDDTRVLRQDRVTDR